MSRSSCGASTWPRSCPGSTRASRRRWWLFLSADYAERDWTRLERRAAFSRAVAEAGVYVLPARFDDSELPWLLPDMVTVDLRQYTPGQFADLVVAKLADLGIAAPKSSANVRQAKLFISYSH